MTQFTMRKDAFGQRATHISNVSEYVDNLYFSAAGNKIATVPEGKTVVFISGTPSAVAVRWNATEANPAAIPTEDVTDGSGVECGPGIERHWPAGEVTTIGIAVNEAGWVSLTFYE